MQYSTSSSTSTLCRRYFLLAGIERVTRFGACLQEAHIQCDITLSKSLFHVTNLTKISKTEWNSFVLTHIIKLLFSFFCMEKIKMHPKWVQPHQLCGTSQNFSLRICAVFASCRHKAVLSSSLGIRQCASFNVNIFSWHFDYILVSRLKDFRTLW